MPCFPSSGWVSWQMQHSLASTVILIFILGDYQKKKKKQGRNIVCQLQIRGSSVGNLRKDARKKIRLSKREAENCAYVGSLARCRQPELKPEASRQNLSACQKPWEKAVSEPRIRPESGGTIGSIQENGICPNGKNSNPKTSVEVYASCFFLCTWN